MDSGLTINISVPNVNNCLTSDAEKHKSNFIEKHQTSHVFAKSSNSYVSPVNSNSVKSKQILKKSKKSVTMPVPKTGIFFGNPEIPNLPRNSKQAVKEEDIYSSKVSISDLNIMPKLKTYICEKMNFQKLTKVQAEALPVLLSGHDALITSETGSGKTLAYAIPVVESLQATSPPITRGDGPLALVFAPTRELALQSYEVFKSLTQPVIRIVPTCIIGGQKKKSEKARIRKGANIIVSTPGRFNDHLDNTACLDLQNVRWLIFDEADRLLDMGFQHQINRILSAVREKSDFTQQVVLLSATLTSGVERLVELSLNKPVRIEIKSEKKATDFMFVDRYTGLKIEKVSLPNTLFQNVVLVPSKIRLVTLLAFINNHCSQKKEKILVFLSCRDSVVFHHDVLKRGEFTEYNPHEVVISIFQLHGGLNQHERTETMQKFKKAESCVVFCTDVAARGLDIPSVDWVIQYDSPGSPVNYIHRVGRTARAGKQGNALLFLTPSEASYVNLLTAFDITVNEIKFSAIVTEVLDYKFRKITQTVKTQHSQEIAGSVHNQLEKLVMGDKSLRESAEKAYLSYVRSYATYPAALKKVFHVKSLHLGHVAKSFALRESPAEISGVIRNNFFKRKAMKSEDFAKRHRTADGTTAGGDFHKKSLNTNIDFMSEFSSGLDRPKLKQS